MQQFRIGRIVGTAVLALGALATTGCLGDSDPVEFEVTDADVIGVGIVMSAQHEVIAGLAEDSDNAAVLELADSMDVRHSAQLTAFDDLDIQGRASNVTQFLQQQTQQIANALGVLTGEDFDQQYVDILIDLHEQNIDFVDEDLLPNVESTALEAEIQALRGILIQGLLEAEELQQEIGVPES